MSHASVYGRKGQIWHPDFSSYAQLIANHDVYAGMPDAFKDNGKIRWEAPSDKLSDKYCDTYRKRRQWWRSKAISIGIEPYLVMEWISRTAKAIHPTKRKPCKRCGLIMDIRYAYPTKLLLRRVMSLPYVEDDFSLFPVEHIEDLIARLYETYGEMVLDDLPSILRLKGSSLPNDKSSLQGWLEWLDQYYIPAEPGTLRPGALASAPDSLDGFHPFNLCCHVLPHRRTYLSVLDDTR